MAFTIPTIFSAVDRVSSVVRNMSNRVSHSLERMENKYGRIQDMSKELAVNSVALGLVIAAPFVIATKEAIKFEDKMADVAKVMNLESGSVGLTNVNNQVKELSVHLATLPEDTAELFSNIAQSGVAADQVARVARIAGEMGVAFGISAGQAGESFVKLQNAMGVTLEETHLVTDALNHLGNSTAAASDQLLEFMASGGAGAARNLGLLGEEAAAFGSVLISNGKSAAEAGTIFERAMKGIFKDAEKMATFRKAGGGLEGLVAVIEKGSKLSGQAQFDYFKSFGEYGTDISMLAKNFDQLQSTLGLVSDRTAFAGSSLAEFENRQKTTAVQLQKLKTAFTIMAVNVGEAILPVLNDIAKRISPIIQKTTTWMSENKELVKIIVIAAGALSGLLLTLGAFATIINVLITIKKAWVAVQAALNITMSANPIGIIIMIIGLLIAAIVFLVTKVKGWGEQWDEVLSFMKAGFLLWWNTLKIGFQGIVYAFTSMSVSIYEGWIWLQNKLGVISDEFYNSELNRINGIKDAQLKAMQETANEIEKHTNRLKQGIEWKLSWDDGDDSPDISNSTSWETGKGPLNPYDAQANTFNSVIEKREKQTVELLVKSDNNSDVDVLKNNGNIPINLTPSFGGFKI